MEYIYPKKLQFAAYGQFVLLCSNQHQVRIRTFSKAGSKSQLFQIPDP